MRTTDKLLAGAIISGVIAAFGTYRWVTAASVETDVGYGITLTADDPVPYRILTIVGFMALAAFAAAWLNHRSKTEVRPDPSGPVVMVTDQVPPSPPAWQPPPFQPEPQSQPEPMPEPSPTPPADPTDPFADLF